MLNILAAKERGPNTKAMYVTRLIFVASVTDRLISNNGIREVSKFIDSESAQFNNHPVLRRGVVGRTGYRIFHPRTKFQLQRPCSACTI